MELKDLKYLLAYLIPLSAIYGITAGGYFSFTTVVLAYIILPFLDALFTPSTSNLQKEIKEKKETSKFFNILLYVNLPIVFFILFLFLQRLTSSQLEMFEIIGLCISTGIVFSSAGINVAHELGHKPEKYNQWIAQLLLLPSLYMHFFIEHNRGHHLNVSTPEDPASARRGEMFYSFWFRSVFGQWIEAWKLEQKRWGRISTFKNQMIHFVFVQLIFMMLIVHFYGIVTLGFFVIAAIISFTQLELVNYIEHYGLQRKKLDNGRYERVTSIHSWNSNHELGRIILYELTRHSDHHFKSAKKYQVLDHHDNSPQLPLGYPASMMMSLIPPLWFRVMDKRIPE